MVYEKKNRSLVFSGSRKIPTLGSTVQWETRQASFPNGTVGPRVGIFLSPPNTNDGFYLSHPHTNNEFFFLLTTKYLILYFKNMENTFRNSWIRWGATCRRNFNITITSRIDVRPACSRRAAVRFFIFPTGCAGMGMWDILEKSVFANVSIYGYAARKL